MIVIVTGMHRSGTSALAGMLHQNGIIMGDVETFYPPARPENPKGFYENVTFRRINDQLLAARKYYVKSFASIIPADYIVPIRRIESKMERIIRACNSENKNWGWKDPRTCLTIKTWMEIFKKIGLHAHVRIINTVRSPNEIAASMIRRGNKGRLKKFRRLANAYQRSFEEGASEYNYLQIDFNDLINHTIPTVRDISEYIEIEIKDTSFLDPRLVNRTTIKGKIRWT